MSCIKSVINASRYVAFTNLTLISTIIFNRACTPLLYGSSFILTFPLPRRVSFPATVLLLSPIYRRPLSAVLTISLINLGFRVSDTAGKVKSVKSTDGALKNGAPGVLIVSNTNILKGRAPPVRIRLIAICSVK